MSREERRPSAVDVALTGLRSAIAQGRLTPGERLPAESELCSQLGVSRSSVREAISMLSALGVLESRRGSGTYVSGLAAEDILRGLSLTVELLPLASVLELYELRRLLESHAAAQAAARCDGDLLRRLKVLLDEIENEPDPERASALDHEFHLSIAHASGNPAVAALVDVLRSRSRSYQLFSLKDGSSIKAISDDQHRRILDAIERRDPSLAAEAAASHVARTEAWLRKYRPAPMLDA